MPVVHQNIFNNATNGLDFNADNQTWTIATGFTVESQQANGVFSSFLNSTLINFGFVISDLVIGVFMNGANATIYNEHDATIIGLKGVVMNGTNANLINHGSIVGFDGAGIQYDVDSTNAQLHNSGYIFSDADAVHVESNASSAFIENSGQIESSDVGIFFGLGSAFVGEVRNTGSVQGDRHAIEIATGQLDLTNLGLIDGDIEARAAADSIRNLGTILGGVEMGDGDDVFNGRNGGVVSGVVNGGRGNDTLTGGDYDDDLSGAVGVDRLNGKAGDDTLDGGSADDHMTGGTGADTFVFKATNDSKLTAQDLITDFLHADGDLLDLSVFLGTLVFKGTDPFSGAGFFSEVRYEDTGKGLRVEVDINRDGTADMAFIVKTVDNQLLISDFIL